MKYICRTIINSKHNIIKKIGILGTRGLGGTMGSKLISLGYEVRMGSRKADGEITMCIIRLINAESLKGKAVADITNPAGFLERDAAIVINKLYRMVNPSISGGEPTMFVSGNDASAKATSTEILRAFGWNDIIDLGDITTARGTEMMLPIWVRK